MHSAKFMFVILLSAVAAFAVEDGIYERGLGGKPDRRVEIEKTRGYVFSEENDNSRWQLHLQFKKMGGLGRRTCRVVLAGKTFDVNSFGGSGDDHTLSIWISKAEVEAATKLFDIKAHERKHPGHMLDAEFKQIEDKDAPDAVMVEFRMKNVGTKAYYFMQGGSQRGPRDDQYTFSCTGPDGKSIPVKEAQNFGGIATTEHVAPGETLKDRVDLKKWFDFAKPGTYYLQGSYEMDIYTSNGVRGDTFPVWHDYVTRTFTVKIGAEK